MTVVKIVIATVDCTQRAAHTRAASQTAPEYHLQMIFFQKPYAGIPKRDENALTTAAYAVPISRERRACAGLEQLRHWQKSFP